MGWRIRYAIIRTIEGIWPGKLQPQKCPGKCLAGAALVQVLVGKGQGSGAPLVCSDCGCLFIGGSRRGNGVDRGGTGEAVGRGHFACFFTNRRRIELNKNWMFDTPRKGG